MKAFQLKQEMWSLGGHFTISDEFGIPNYQVMGSFLHIPKTYSIKDMEGNLVSQIEKEFFSLLPKFKVHLACGQDFILRKDMTLLKPRYHIDNLNMIIQGDLWDMDFNLIQEDKVLAKISQEWLNVSSIYNIEVHEEALSDLVISLVVAIDCVKEMEGGTSRGS